MKYSLLTTLLYLCICLFVCFAQDCHAAKSWADIVSASPKADAPSNTVVVDQQTAPSIKKRTLPLGVYTKLPRSASLHKVRNVYDGDTLTLVDERRVRFLGVDTPELKEQQAYAQEAKAYTKQHCHKKNIYLDVQGEDKYGRLLAFVWVQLEDGTYLNVNEGLVANGLATVYLASKDERLSNFKTMLALQKEARNSRKGVWKNFVERNVVVTQYGSAYHLPTCRHLAKSRNTNILKASAAVDQGLHACRTCLADEI